MFDWQGKQKIPSLIGKTVKVYVRGELRHDTTPLTDAFASERTGFLVIEWHRGNEIVSTGIDFNISTLKDADDNEINPKDLIIEQVENAEIGPIGI